MTTRFTLPLSHWVTRESPSAGAFELVPDNATRRSVRTLQYLSGGTTHTWTYSHTTATFAGVQHGLLTEVKPPVGPSWKYRYNFRNYS